MEAGEGMKLGEVRLDTFNAAVVPVLAPVVEFVLTTGVMMFRASMTQTKPSASSKS